MNVSKENHFTVINGSSEVLVGHCSKNERCNEAVCVGTDCKKYQYKHGKRK